MNIVDRETRMSTAAGWIVEASPSSLEVLNTVNFGRGQVNEIRALDATDSAHHNMPWTGRYGA